MSDLFVSAFVSLFVVIDPLGCAPIYAGLSSGASQRQALAIHAVDGIKRVQLGRLGAHFVGQAVHGDATDVDGVTVDGQKIVFHVHGDPLHLRLIGMVLTMPCGVTRRRSICSSPFSNAAASTSIPSASTKLR